MKALNLLERSRVIEPETFPGINCLNVSEALTAVEANEKIVHKPIWTFESSLEGSLYREYISANPNYTKILLRPTLSAMLIEAADLLPSGVGLALHAGHRPIEVQLKTLNLVADEFLINNPGATKEEALEHARIYVKDPAQSVPPHCCGAAIDLQLIDLSSMEYLDFGSEVNENSDISFLHSNKVSPEAYRNRMLLFDVMTSVGFASFYAEWWHYSYGCQSWAWFYNKKDYLYSVIDLKDGAL
jgi:D-alanyl-D-alanine dipeptidase